MYADLGSEAMLAGDIGLEAAVLILRMGRPDHAAAWVARARVRTVMDLLEEVHIAQTHARPGDCSSYLAPPSDEALAEYQQARASVLSGEAFGIGGSGDGQSEDGEEGGASAAQLFVTEQDADVDGPAASDPPPRGSGMRTLRVNLPDDLARWWRQLHRRRRRAHCAVDLGETFVEFLCLAMVNAWRENIEAAQRH